MKKVFSRPESLRAVETHYCPGCGHGIVHRLVAEVVDELGIREKVVGVVPVGCACIAYEYFNFDCSEAPHGRTPAVATGLKRARPELVVFSYQGDGDLAAIGTAEIVHTANRGENITVIFVNNAVYGMTGGQMAPTTLLGQRTATSPKGRDFTQSGAPIRVCELLGVLDGVRYAHRVSVVSPKRILAARRALKRAFEIQLAGEGFAIVEILSPCPTYWRMTPPESCRWVEEEMSRYFPLGLLKDTTASGKEKKGGATVS